MRYTVTYEIYIEGDNDSHAFSKAQLIAKNQNRLYPNQQWDATKLHRTPFASMNTTEVDMTPLKYAALDRAFSESGDLPF
jgi:hypothetical protein